MTRIYTIAEPIPVGAIVRTPTGRTATIVRYTNEGRAFLRYRSYPNDAAEIFPKLLTPVRGKAAT